MSDFKKKNFLILVKKQSIPIATWNSEQNNILQYQPFVILLHKLGFHLPADSGKLFIRIPVFWTADILYMIARQLGTIDSGEYFFSLTKNK